MSSKEKLTSWSRSKKRHIGRQGSSLKKKCRGDVYKKNAFDEGYVNGTLGVVEDFDNNGAPIVRTFSGRKIFVTPADWTVEEEGKVLARVEQLPLPSWRRRLRCIKARG